MGNGMSAGFVFERGADKAGTLNRRHQNAWIKAGWGKLTLGQQGNPYRSVANWDQSYWLGGSAHSLANYNVDGGSRLNGIRYDGGSGPFSISVMGTAAANDEGQSAYKTRVNAVNGTTINQDNHIVLTHPEVERVDGIDSIVVAAHYNLGSATINLGLRTNSLESNELDSEYSNTALSANGSAGALDWVCWLRNELGQLHSSQPRRHRNCCWYCRCGLCFTALCSARCDYSRPVPQLGFERKKRGLSGI